MSSLSRRLARIEAAQQLPALDTSMRDLALANYPDVRHWLELGMPEPDPCRLAALIPKPWIFPEALKRGPGARRLAFATALHELVSEVIARRGGRILGRPEPAAGALVTWLVDILEADMVCDVLENNASLYLANAEATLANDFAGGMPPLAFRGLDGNACGLWGFFWRQPDCHADCQTQLDWRIRWPELAARYPEQGSTP